MWNRNFTILWIGLLQSFFGSVFLAVGLTWLVLQITGSIAAASLILVIEGLPKLLGPLAGAIVDQYDKRRLMILTDVVRGVMLVLFFVLFQYKLLPLWALYSGVAVMGICSIFYGPALRVILPQVVPAQKLTKANAMLQTASQIAAISGGAVAGWVLTRLDTSYVLLIDGLSFLIMSLALLWVRLPPNVAPSSGRSVKALMSSMGEGLRYIGTNRTLLILILIAFMINLALSPVNILFPVFSQTILQAGIQGFGFLASSIAVGLLLGGLLYGALSDKISLRGAIIFGLALLSGSLFALSITTQLVWAISLVALMGMSVAPIQVALVTFLQTLVPTAMQGRVFANMQTVTALALPLSATLIGQALLRIPISMIFIITASLLLVILLVWLWAAPANTSKALEETEATPASD